MDSDGITSFFTDMKVDLEHPVTLLISYLMGAKQQGEYTFEMVKKGCMEVGADSIDGWYKVVPDLTKKLNQDQALFRKVYMFTFEFS